MITVTEVQKATPPDADWVESVCKLGQGAACCRFLMIGEHGFTCEKTGDMAAELTRRATAGIFVAISDNCEGRASV